ncbi:MAG: hypothetical protein CBD99_002080 [Candidatus Pelagibacter sp. TMED239]|nr:MAG: hypothetical protein CBD99_002080 [Candidatus Pelagibacter sp. TMED239]|tara:strand:+ start:4441 stop:5289 length:849 start_codon:yes stop_codon:yes gene_type:complete
MKFLTFYKTYYSHRVKKASIYLKYFIFLSLPLIYLLNKILYPKVKNLENFANKNTYLYEKDLGFLFQFFNSDKGEFFINQYDKPLKSTKNLKTGHSYHKFYEKYFKPIKDQKLDILEIGSFKGNATASFYFYFKKSQIISCDIYPDFFLYNSNRIKHFKIDNSSERELNINILEKNINFDIIIEDAGHYFKDQIISLFMLFRSLKPGGIFVVEELDFPDTRDDMNVFKEKPSLREILNSINQNHDFSSKYVTNVQKEYFLNHFKDIKIFKGQFNEIAFITKK